MFIDCLGVRLAENLAAQVLFDGRSKATFEQCTRGATFAEAWDLRFVGERGVELFGFILQAAFGHRDGEDLAGRAGVFDLDGLVEFGVLGIVAGVNDISGRVLGESVFGHRIAIGSGAESNQKHGQHVVHRAANR